MPTQIYGTKIFVGREKEIAEFEAMLDSSETSQWILNVHGPGGIGKTQLLHKFVDLVEQRQANGDDLLITKEFIDLYWTENRRTLGMLKNIADQLSREQFMGFFTELEKYNRLLSQQFLTESSLLREQEERAKSTFFGIYRNLPSKRIILIFDTTELAGEAAFELWQSFSMLSKDGDHKTALVLAGRRRLGKFSDDDCTWLPVTGLSVDQVKVYFESMGIDLSLNVVEKVAELSQGRPILIALTVDWLRFGRLPDDLMSYTPEQFVRAMVERVQQLQVPEDQIILAMAHFYRRFDEQLLAYVLKHIFKKPSVDGINKTESLAKYSFIKYRPPVGDKPGSCTLHDEMRDLVVKYVWDVLDPRKEERCEWSKVILTYYADKVNEEKDQSERQNLRLERLFYWCDADIHQAFDYSRQLVVETLHQFDFQFIKAINTEFIQRENSLTPEEHSELILRRAAVLHSEGKTQEAKQKIESVSDHLAGVSTPLLVWLIEFYVDSGDPAKALEVNLQGNLEVELETKIYNSVGEERKSLEFALGVLCNNLGYTARNQGHMNTAVGYYERGLDHFKEAGDAYAYLARARNNLGFVLHRLGRDEEALAHCEMALKIRQHLQNPYEIGLSYNVMGQIYTDLMRVEEAIGYFEKAIQAFERAGNDRGKALVYVAYGRLMRQWGWYKEDFAKDDFKPDREDYRKSSYLLDAAIDLFRKQSDRSNLCEALNEKGTLLRQQKKWNEALTFYHESMQLAKEINNTYREIDNLQDMGILYEFWGNDVQSDYTSAVDRTQHAMEYAQRASDLAWNNNSFYLYARAQRTMGEVFFNLGEYDKAFESASRACIYVLRPDPDEPGHSSAKKNLVYDKFEDWASDLILRLPTQEWAEKICDYLMNCWMEQEQGGKRLADLYPGFISKMKSLKMDYPLLKITGKGD